MRQITLDAINAFENSKKFIKSNTRVAVCDDGTIELYLFENKIAEKINGNLFITNAGWKSVTTKERLNGLDGVNVTQAKGLWYLNGEKWSGKWARVDTFTGDIDPVNEKADRAMLRRIKKYSLLYKAPYPMPSSGDCWMCNGTIDRQTGKEHSKTAHQHLLDHIEEEYVHGSLIVNALREKHYSDMQISIALNSTNDFWQVQPAVYNYLKKRLTNLA